MPAKQRESAIERLAVALSKEQGVECRKLQWVSRAHAPDRLFMANELTVFVEFKRPGELPRAGQCREIRRLLKAGQAVYVIDNELDVHLLMSLLKAGDRFVPEGHTLERKTLEALEKAEAVS